MDKKIVNNAIMGLAEYHKIEISENSFGGWAYAGTYANIIITPEINGEKTDWIHGEIWWTLQIDISISNIGNMTPANMLKAAAEMKKVAEFAEELENMGLEYVERREVSA